MEKAWRPGFYVRVTKMNITKAECNFNHTLNNHTLACVVLLNFSFVSETMRTFVEGKIYFVLSLVFL
jgi:hypothetical protein